MKNPKSKVLITCLIWLSAINLMARENNNPSEFKYLNSFNSYVGLIEFSFNYERNIILSQKSYSNIKAGYGYWTNLQLEGKCYEIAFVHLIGRKNSHPELNLGIKYIVDNAGKENAILPDIFAGYRYENPEGRFIFRIGLAFPSIFNMGIGFKF